MLASVDWEEKKYQEVFDDETRLLVRRRAADARCTIEDVQGILDSLYVLDGNNAEGRSSVQQIALSATIAAYEAFIHQWKKESTM
jgi:hypothetical protein